MENVSVLPQRDICLFNAFGPLRPAGGDWPHIIVQGCTYTKQEPFFRIVVRRTKSLLWYHSKLPSKIPTVYWSHPTYVFSHTCLTTIAGRRTESYDHGKLFFFCIRWITWSNMVHLSIGYGVFVGTFNKNILSISWAMRISVVIWLHVFPHNLESPFIR